MCIRDRTRTDRTDWAGRWWNDAEPTRAGSATAATSVADAAETRTATASWAAAWSPSTRCWSSSSTSGLCDESTVDSWTTCCAWSAGTTTTSFHQVAHTHTHTQTHTSSENSNVSQRNYDRGRPLEGAILLRAVQAHLPSLGQWAHKWIYHRVCDARPVTFPDAEHCHLAGIHFPSRWG